MNNTSLDEEQDSQHDIKDFAWFQFNFPVRTEDKDIKQKSKIEEPEPIETRFFYEFILRHSWKKK